MTMRRYADLMTSTGSFVGADGEKAKRWLKLGILMKDDTSGAMSLKLDAIPVSPTWSGWIAVRNMVPDSE